MLRRFFAHCKCSIPPVQSFVRAVSTTSSWTVSKADFDPHGYTSGRWLRLDDRQLKARQIAFDFDKLRDKVISCSAGASSIVKCVKVEGGFNRAFIIQLDNGASLVARIPFSVAGPARLTTNSEMATMEYIRKNTTVPLPTVLDWSDDPTNPIGTEYIIMEHAPGVSLHHRWGTMNVEQRILVIKSLGLLCQQMASLQFPAYGSLYFIGQRVAAENSIPLSERFCIGPHCGNRYWNTMPGDEHWYERAPPNRGPWKSHEDYVRGLLDVGLSRIPVLNENTTRTQEEAIQDHLHLNRTAKDTLLAMVASPVYHNVQRPTFLHRDLHKRNIFVSDEDPTQITCLIDWQSSSIEPAYSYDETPDLCEFPTDWHESQVSDPPTKEQQNIMTSVDLCRQTWAVILRGYLPVLFEARTMDQDLLRLLQYIPSAWRHGAVLIREDLIQLSRRWTTDLKLPGTCPYQPTEEDLKRQAQLLPQWRELHDVRQVLFKGLRTDADGWIPIDHWDILQDVHRELFDEWVGNAAAEVGFTEEEARAAWPFDEPGDSSFPSRD
ncbi:unnamed protein product [Zymoseptoria tritici ST99CH_1A5]|uniref:Altered inheritance of mitochondria protein 9, mitochondrial n=1 Tax=Zymoseptoria tritici ST99CH_1A5 TaxID=1276529 RepID=A0A1Y6L9Z0_ZYMTR|nr:unnamed protein product [Zymoseptoria tritici ST99CH_1A5]